MKERIGKLIGNGLESKLILGTFHSIARRYLARYGYLIGIKKDFGIADSGDSAAIIKRIVKRYGYMIDPKVARARISGYKARGAGYKDEMKPLAKKAVEAQEFEKVYEQYEAALERSNLLDYDDLLLRCVELLRNHPTCVSNVEAVLIDEFQDTNVVQFDLMRLFAAERKRITIVGDPDQSIYGFRAAETKNYKRLLHQYPSTITIALEENYRSSGSILLSALTIIQQDNGRVNKSLLATHSVGTKPVLRKLANAHKEAEWIVTEVQRCMGMTGDLLDLNDFAILVRSAALSRLIESALGKSGIAYRMVGGLRFYDRLEVKLVLDYLRVINQPNANDALARIINTPSRRIGDMTIKSLLEEAETSKITLWRLVLDSVQGRRTVKCIKAAQSTGLCDLVNIILTGQKKLAVTSVTERPSIKAMIDYLLEKLDFENYLKKQHNDDTGSRWENIQELITQAIDFQDLLQSGYEDEALPIIDNMEQTATDGYLSRFLANVALASEVKSEETNSKPQLTISTIHAAKGLEWPVVFIPAAYEGSIPHSRAEDTDEERRLLYVAMTRAKALLYMSCPLKNSQSDETKLSPFLTQESSRLLAESGPSMGSSMVMTMADILRRGCPSPQSIIESTKSLFSTEDDRFPIDGNEREDLNLKWSLTQGSQRYLGSQRSPKRRKLDFDRSNSNGDDVRSLSSSTSSVGNYHVPTTMSGFTKASSVQILQEQSINTVPTTIREKGSSKSMSKIDESQGTLLGYLGKQQPLSLPAKPAPARVSSLRTISSSFNRPRVEQVRCVIDRELSDHKIVPRVVTKPKPQDSGAGYPFLSSSPTRKSPEPIQDEPPPLVQRHSAGLTNAPKVLEYMRPPSMHITSLDMVKSDGVVKKSLGMRRSGVSGWQAGKFKPPTMKKPL